MAAVLSATVEIKKKIGRKKRYLKTKISETMFD
jgi:hypothetical protein